MEIKNLLVYVRENKTWTAEQELSALNKIKKYRCDIGYADPDIRNKVHDLMEEFRRENGLSEKAFEEYDEHYVFMHI